MRKSPCLASVILVLVSASFHLFREPEIISGKVLPGSTKIDLESVTVSNATTAVIQNKGVTRLQKGQGSLIRPLYDVLLKPL
jgi:hypothetical protein